MLCLRWILLLYKCPIPRFTGDMDDMKLHSLNSWQQVAMRISLGASRSYSIGEDGLYQKCPFKLFQQPGIVLIGTVPVGVKTQHATIV